MCVCGGGGGGGGTSEHKSREVAILEVYECRL